MAFFGGRVAVYGRESLCIPSARNELAIEQMIYDVMYADGDSSTNVNTHGSSPSTTFFYSTA